MLHIYKFFFSVIIIIFFVRFCFLGSSENTQSRKKNTMSSMKVITELDQDVELIKNCSLLQIVKKDLERFIFFFLGGGGGGIC